MRTYSRQKSTFLRDVEDARPAKRQRVQNAREALLERACTTLTRTASVPISSGLSIPSDPPPHEDSSDAADLPPSTPPSSPPSTCSGPLEETPEVTVSALQTTLVRKRTLGLKRRVALQETTGNIRKRPKAKNKMQAPLKQLQLDLGGSSTTTCKECGMAYVVSDDGDVKAHKEYHKRLVDGEQFLITVTDKRLKTRPVTRPLGDVSRPEGSCTLVVIERHDYGSLRKSVMPVLERVNEELGAANIPAESLWAPRLRRPAKVAPHGSVDVLDSKSVLMEGEGEPKPVLFDTPYKVYLCVVAGRCVGVCLAERIQEAHRVLDSENSPVEDVVKQDGRRAIQIPKLQASSSIWVENLKTEAKVGISRIWTVTGHREKGIARILLDYVRDTFLYGEKVDKDMIAFSQPSESGGQLARKWFGKETGWLVYID